MNSCNTSITFKTCILAPTNRDTSSNLKSYNCLCENGYTNDAAAVCQGFNSS